MTDDLELRRIQGKKGHAWKQGNDLAVAHWEVEYAKIMLARARANLEERIVQHYNQGESPSEIARASLTARSHIYVILNRHDLLPTEDPLARDHDEPRVAQRGQP